MNKLQAKSLGIALGIVAAVAIVVIGCIVGKLLERRQYVKDCLEARYGESFIVKEDFSRRDFGRRFYRCKPKANTVISFSAYTNEEGIFEFDTYTQKPVGEQLNQEIESYFGQKEYRVYADVSLTAEYIEGESIDINDEDLVEAVLSGNTDRVVGGTIMIEYPSDHDEKALAEAIYDFQYYMMELHPHMSMYVTVRAVSAPVFDEVMAEHKDEFGVKKLLQDCFSGKEFDRVELEYGFKHNKLMEKDRIENWLLTAD